MKTIDTCGKTSPTPLIMIQKAIKSASAGDKIEVIADSLETFGELKDYLSDNGVGFREIYNGEKLRLQFTVLDNAPINNIHAESEFIVAIKSDKMGEDNDKLGLILQKEFLTSLANSQELPSTVILYNSGVKAAFRNTDTAKSLQKLEKKGVLILVCETSLDFFSIQPEEVVGDSADMDEIVRLMSEAKHVVYP